MDKKDLLMAVSYWQAAMRSSGEARKHFESFSYDKSIRESQEAIEISVKAIFYAFGVEPPKNHEFKEDDFKRILDKIPQGMTPAVSNEDFIRPYLYSRFWSAFYTTMKYGLEKLKVGPGRLFGKEEAELALKHADFCVGIGGTAVNYYGPKILEYHSVSPETNLPKDKSDKLKSDRSQDR